MSLSKRNALVTGSTSGIGLAIARAFAKEGANVVINGFGDAAAIETERAGIERSSASRRFYNGADMTQAREIAAMVKDAEKSSAARHSRQQCRHPVCRADRGFPGRQMGPDHRHQSVRRLPRHPRRGSRHEGAEMGPHHLHRLGPFARRLAVQVGLCLGQARHRRPDQDGGAGSSRTFGVTANCISPGYVWTPLVENQIPDTMKARNLTREQVINDVLLAAQPTKQFVTVDQVAALAVYLCSRRGQADHRRQSLDRRRLDRGMTAWRQSRRPRIRRARRSTSPCRAAARTAPIPGACSTRCSRMSGSTSRRSAAPAPAP